MTSLNDPMMVEDQNQKLFSGLVLQTLINRLPSSMPAFDRISIIEKVKESVPQDAKVRKETSKEVLEGIEVKRCVKLIMKLRMLKKSMKMC